MLQTNIVNFLEVIALEMLDDLFILRAFQHFNQFLEIIYFR